MSRPPAARRALLLAAGMLLPTFFAAGRARADVAAQSCSDCCKLACIEAEILKAKYQRQEYEKLSKRKNLTQEAYHQEEARMGAIGERFRLTAADGLETCNYYIPEGQSYPESRKFISAGFKIQRDAQGRLLPSDYTLTTDPNSCVANSAALDLAPQVAPCSGIGDAQVQHEMKHVEDCCKRTGGTLSPDDGSGRRDCAHAAGGRPAPALSPAQTAANELPGYDKEISELEKARREAAQACSEKSCTSAQPAWDKSAERLGFLLSEILAKGGSKPAPKGPLARKSGGH